ncbi:MAG: hypothetical protein LJE97_13510 [Betaproteobacteria bacterium]|jgi:hypothetical protein|nr:hypothetical protein [Betaproteobacteria bacterium]
MDLGKRLEELDTRIGALETSVGATGDAALADVLEPAIRLANDTMCAYIEAAGEKAPPAQDADILETWKVLVKGDPTWNAIRDNCRELVFYRNCIVGGRADALPAAPARMAVRLVRHVYLYVRVRCAREGRVAG